MVKDDTPVEEGVLNLRLSDVRTFLQCPRRFYFEVLKKLYPQPEVDTGAEIEYEVLIETDAEDLVVQEREAKRRDEGTMVHSVAEAYYRREIFYDVDDPEALRQSVNEIIDAKALTLTTDIYTKSWEEARRYAKAMAQGFIPWVEFEGHDVGKIPVSVETREHVDIGFNYGEYHTLRLSGQHDIIERDTMVDDLGVGDTKTVQSLKKGGPRESDYQLVGYGWIHGMNTGEFPTYGYQNLVQRSLQTARATGPFYRRIPIAMTPEKLGLFERQMYRTVVDIGTLVDRLSEGSDPATLFGYSETMLCDMFCRTKLVCDAMSSGQPGRWQEMANEHFGGTFEEVYDD